MKSLMELSLSERICYSTLRIEAQLASGGTSTGTGFLFNFKIDESLYFPTLITNKHVIEGSNTTTIVVSCINDSEQWSYERVFIESALWILHPDCNTDLCLLPIQLVYNFLENKGKHPFVAPLDETLIPSQAQLEDLTAIEDIIMIGYPDGIWDEYNNQPIIRRGITATHPVKDFNGKQEFLIDAACFPGSSGSPVLILNEGGYKDKHGNLNWGSSRVFFLGVMYAGPQHTAEGGIAFASIPRTYTSIPNNLGLVIKSFRLLSFKPILLEKIKNQQNK